MLDEVAHAQILASDANLACRHLIERQPELVHVHETANTRFVVDLDTVQDVQALAARTGWRLELPGWRRSGKRAVCADATVRAS